MAGILYLFPVNVSDSPLDQVLPKYNRQLLTSIRAFIVEDVRTARRFIKKCEPTFDIDACTFFPLNKHTTPEEMASYLKLLLEGNDMGLMSEAGCPAVADPGADIVSLAQKKRIKVVPLVGPSSLLLALMGSGFNGQRFAFEGYLPVEKEDRVKALKRLEQRSWSEDTTFLFIETPYRNNKLMEDMLATLRPQTRICVAYDLTGPNESIVTLTTAQWKNHPGELSKKPCIFLLYKG